MYRKFDSAGEIHFKRLVKSRIFKLFSIPYVQSAVALPAVYLVLTQLSVGSPVTTSVAVVAVLILVHLGTFIERQVRRNIIPIAWRAS